jgi:heme/copper-type cytochrome/quinol oxidase subunit 2
MSTGMIIVLTGVAFFLLTCVALLDIARKDFGGIQFKALWAFIVALVPFIGVVVYFLFGFRKGKRPADDVPAA